MMDDLINLIHESKAGRQVRAAAIAEITRLRAELAQVKADADARVAATCKDVADFVEGRATFERSAKEPAGLNMDPPLTAAGIAERRLMNAARERLARMCDQMSGAIRAWPPADADAALSRIRADARRQALQEAAAWIESVPQSLPDRQHYARCIRGLDKIEAEQ